MKDGTKSTDNLKSKKSKGSPDEEKKKAENESGKKSGPKK